MCSTPTFARRRHNGLRFIRRRSVSSLITKPTNTPSDTYNTLGYESGVMCPIDASSVYEDVVLLQFELAHSWSASVGAGACVPVSGTTGIYSCSFPQVPPNWCSNVITTNPPGPGGIVQNASDFNVGPVVVPRNLGKVGSPFYLSYAPCIRVTQAGPGGWVCAPPLSFPQGGQLPLQPCTFFPYQ